MGFANLLSKEIPSSSSISTANSDVAKVLELKDSIRSEGHTRNRENYFVELFSVLKTRKFWSSKIKSYTVCSARCFILLVKLDILDQTPSTNPKYSVPTLVPGPYLESLV